MNVVYALTRNVYHYILPSMKSLAEHNPKARVFVLAEDDELPFSLPMKAEVINVSGQEWFPKDGVNYYNAFSYINLLKVCYPLILPVKKVIHIDADTIICDSLEEMWKTDVSGKWVAACMEEKSTYKPFGKLYYNMGVALINLEQMRKDKIIPTLVEYLNTVKQPWADQDAWNKYGLEQDKFVRLATRWNECFATGYTDDPAIVHYCGMHDWWTRRKMYRKEYLERYR